MPVVAACAGRKIKGKNDEFWPIVNALIRILGSPKYRDL
jgi:hypothetical protein